MKSYFFLKNSRTSCCINGSISVRYIYTIFGEQGRGQKLYFVLKVVSRMSVISDPETCGRHECGAT
jgi:hypothetical protein